MQAENAENNRVGKFVGGCMKAAVAALFCILFYLFFHGFFVFDQIDFVRENLGRNSGVLAVFLSFCFVGSLFCLMKNGLNLLDGKQLKGVMFYAFVGMLALQLLFLFRFRSMYLWDGAFVVGGATSLLETGKISQDALYYLSVYKNQHPFLVLTAFLLWIGRSLSLSVADRYLLLNVVNTLCLDVAIVFLLKIAGYLLRHKEKNSRLKSQCGLLLLFVLNPFVYVFAGYYYTIILSLPFFTGGMYFACKVLSGNKKHIVSAAVLFAVGYALHATTIIPVIACVMTGFLIAIVKRDVKRFFQSLATAVLAIVLGTLLCGMSGKVVGLDTTDTAFPATHWIMMSMTSPGCHNEEDEAFTASFTTREEKQRAVEERLVEKVKALGIPGLVRLLSDKVDYTWESGNHTYSFFTGNCLSTDGFYDQIYGAKKDLLALYGQGFYLVLIGCSMLTIWKSFFLSYSKEEKKTRCLKFFFCLTLLGGFLFYMLWETGTQYSLVFFPLFFVLSDFWLCGSETEIDGGLPKTLKKHFGEVKERRIRGVMMVTGILVFLLFCCFWWKNRNVFTSQVYKRTDTVALQLLANSPYEVKEEEVFLQEIKAYREFDQLIFQFRNLIPEEENDSVYSVKLYRNHMGKRVIVWEETIVAQGQPQNGAFIKEFETQKAGNYEIEIVKTGGSKEKNLSFVTYKMGGYDAYTKGRCLLNQVPLSRDLMFGLYKTEELTYTTSFRYAGLALVFFIYFLFWEICCILRGWYGKKSLQE